MDLPQAWKDAFARDAAGAAPPFADPVPERRIARLLGAFIATGLAFLVLPGTLIGVWNLLTISSRRHADAMSAAWIQAHGHAQLFGWVATFIIGIAMYSLPKFRNGTLRSLPLAWGMWAAWTIALALRWLAALNGSNWTPSAAIEFIVAVLVIWQCSAKGPSYTVRQVWELPIFAGLTGLAVTLGVQWIVAAPVIPADRDKLFLFVAVWGFCFPTVIGFSARFLPSFLGLEKPRPIWPALACAAIGFVWPPAVIAAAAAACWSLRVFERPARPAKLNFVDPRYPWFARAAYGWLLVSAALVPFAGRPGLLGASRHAFTVGFLAGLIFALGPRILPSFLNSRELWSVGLMRWAMVLLTAGCTLRVSSEPLAYAGLVPAAWSVLPVSAILELTAVLMFALNMAKSMATPMPAWFTARHVKDSMPLYWYVNAYPASRKVLIQSGLATLGRSRTVPKSLTLADAAHADGADLETVLTVLREFFARRAARAISGL